MIERITKKMYLFLLKHFRALIWYLYLSPVVGVISCNDLILTVILLFDAFLSLVMTTGNMKQWNKEVQ